MPDRRLPDHPNVDQLKHQARDLLNSIRRGEASAVVALKKHHPGTLEPGSVKLADAQLVLARSYGASSWPRLVFACRLIDAIWREDVELVRELGMKDPELLHMFARRERQRYIGECPERRCASISPANPTMVATSSAASTGFARCA